jgi:hypothetical protein
MTRDEQKAAMFIQVVAQFEDSGQDGTLASDFEAMARQTRRTPFVAYHEREKARPGPFKHLPRNRVRRDVVDPGGKVSIR